MIHFYPKPILVALICLCANIRGSAQTQDQHVQPGTGISSDQAIECSVALKFINEYVAFCSQAPDLKHESAWIMSNPLLTDNFKKTYNKIINQYGKNEPRDADPVFDAQDFPEGFALSNCDNGFVTVKGLEWKDFLVVIRVVKYKNDWLIDGSGIINIPEDKRAIRE